MLHLYFNQSHLNKIAALVIILSSSMVYAGVSPNEKREVLKKASSYAQSVACNTTFEKNAEHKTTSKDVFLIETQNFDNQEFGTRYLVFWGGDYACAGGSGTYGFFLTSLERVSDTRPFLVVTENILDDINEDVYQINTRFVQNVHFNNGKLIIISSDYSNKKEDFEGNNFPANRYQYTLVYDKDNYKWKLVDKKFIGKNR